MTNDGLISLGLALGTFLKQLIQLDFEPRHNRAGQPPAGAMDKALPELLTIWTAVNFNLLLRRKNQPHFFYASPCVSRKLESIVFDAAHTHLDDESGRTRVLGTIILDRALHDRKVGFRL